MGDRVVHFEIPVDDVARAAQFYTNVFGWQITKWAGPVDYWVINTGAPDTPGIDGGFATRGGPTTHTTNSIDVVDLDETLRKVQENGGQVIFPKMPVPGVGWLAYAQDVEGNSFGMMQSDVSAH